MFCVFFGRRRREKRDLLALFVFEFPEKCFNTGPPNRSESGIDRRISPAQLKSRGGVEPQHTVNLDQMRDLQFAQNATDAVQTSQSGVQVSQSIPPARCWDVNGHQMPRREWLPRSLERVHLRSD